MVSAQYPDAIGLGDITEITDTDLRLSVSRKTTVTHLLHSSGPPCQNVSGLNPSGGGVNGSKSKLVRALPQLRAQIRKVFPHAIHGDLCEMVASLSQENQEAYDKINAGLPYRVCPGSMSYVRRPRLFWTSWDLIEGPGAHFRATNRWIDVKLTAKKMPLTRLSFIHISLC